MQAELKGNKELTNVDKEDKASPFKPHVKRLRAKPLVLERLESRQCNGSSGPVLDKE